MTRAKTSFVPYWLTMALAGRGCRQTSESQNRRQTVPHGDGQLFMIVSTSAYASPNCKVGLAVKLRNAEIEADGGVPALKQCDAQSCVAFRVPTTCGSTRTLIRSCSQSAGVPNRSPT